MKRPAFQFYPGDWLEDMGLRACSLTARGLWVDMLCFMHQGEPYGHLRRNGRDVAMDDLARMVGASRGNVERLLAELEERHVFSRTDAGTIHSRRMVRDEQLREVRAEGGQKGGVKAFKNPRASRPGQKREGGRPSLSNGGTEGGLAVTPPSSPSPSPSPGTDNGSGRQRAPANPFVTGKRDEYETESMRLVREIEALTGEDGAEIFAKAAHYDGALRQKVNPAGLTDDRLLNTVIDLRATLRDEQAKRAVRV